MSENNELEPSVISAVRPSRRMDPYLIALVVLILFAALFYSYAYHHEHLPYRSTGYDTYSHLGILRSVEEQIGVGEDLVPGLFPSLYRNNNRSGINYVAMALIASVPGSSNFFALYVFGLLSIAVLLAGIYYLTKTLSGSSRAAFLAALLSLIVCGYDAVVHGNSYTFVELMVVAHYASTLAVGTMLFAIAFNVKYMSKGGWKFYLMQVLLATFVFNIHMLTGIQYFFILCILVAVYALKEKRFSRRHLLLLAIIPAALLLASLWPIYHWWDIFNRGAVGLDGREGKLTSILPFLEASVLYFIGLPFLIRAQKERLFLLFWALAFAAVSLSFLTPLSIAYYWRFLYIMRIPLVMGLALGLAVDIWALARWRKVAIPVILGICLAFIGVSAWRTELRYEELTQKDAYAEVEPFTAFAQEGEVVVAQPAPGYNLMGLSSYNVISVLGGHAPKESIGDKNERLYEAYLLPYPETWEQLLEEYGTREVLVPKSFSYRDVTFLLNGTRMEGNEFYDLYLVDPSRLDTRELTATPDPELEQSSIAYGFTRFEHWVDFQYTGRRDIILEAVKEPGDPAASYASVASDDPEGGLIFLNRGFITVDPTRRYTIKTTSRESEGEPKAFLTVYQYTSASPVTTIAIFDVEFLDPSTSWKDREFTIGPMFTEGVDMVFVPDARYVKVGLVLCYESTGRIDVDSIEIVPE